MSVLGIKAYFDVPDAFAPRCCEAVLLLTGWACGRAKLRALCALCSSPSSCWCREQRFQWVGLPRVYIQRWEEILISTAPPETAGTFLVYDT